jgi:hypothetical protein
LLYQKANNHWLWKLAHGRELYLVPTGDIATVVFVTELLSQLRNRGIDLDHVSQTRARQDGKTLDKTSNTKYAAQLIAEHIQGWLPTRSTDPDSQHEITNLRIQLAELRQRLGDDNAEVSTPPRPERALLGNSTAPTPPTFDPACLLTVPTTSNAWLADNMPTSLADRPFAKWVKDLPLSDVQDRNMAGQTTR